MSMMWLGLLACAGGSGEPTLAVDHLYVEPDGDDIVGFQTWEIYDETFGADDAYVCGIVFSLEGTPTQEWACDACDHLWQVEVERMESDCPERWASEPAFAALSAVGIGTLGPSLTSEDPHDGRSSGGYIDPGDGEVIPHGWAYPEGLDTGGDVLGDDWGTDQGWVLWPAWAWELDTP